MVSGKSNTNIWINYILAESLEWLTWKVWQCGRLFCRFSKKQCKRYRAQSASPGRQLHTRHPECHPAVYSVLYTVYIVANFYSHFILHLMVYNNTELKAWEQEQLEFAGKNAVLHTERNKHFICWLVLWCKEVWSRTGLVFCFSKPVMYAINCFFKFFNDNNSCLCRWDL